MANLSNLIEHLEKRVESQAAEARKYGRYADNREKEAEGYRRQEAFHENEANAAREALADLKAKHQRIRLYGVDPITQGGEA